MAGGEVYRELGEAGWAWVLCQVREDGGPWLPEVVAEDGQPAVPGVDRDSLYAGIGGLAPVLAEIGQHRALSSTEQALSAGIAARLSATAGARADASLYLGLGGDVTALKLLAPGSERVALGRLAGLMTPAGWNTPPETGTGSAAPVNDLVLGTAGVVLAVVWAGGEHSRAIAATVGEALLRAADQTKDGLDWAMMAGRTSRMPNYSHGTAGIATALAIAGAALNRDDFIVAARHGAQHLLTVGSLADGGFIIPHTLPYSRRDVEPVTYTWCHGPAERHSCSRRWRTPAWTLSPGSTSPGCGNGACARSWPPVSRSACARVSGITTAAAAAPPGSGTSCSTRRRTAPARRLTAPCCRGRAPWQTPSSSAPSATKPGHGGGSSSTGQDPPLLPPGTSWMQGAAGIAAFLLRLARVLDNGLGAPVVDRPDQWWAVPGRLRTVHTHRDVLPDLP